MLETLIHQLNLASSVVLSTHRNSDGDGLGAQIALFHGLKQLGKQVRIINPDQPPKKYAYLHGDEFIGIFGLSEVPASDLALILDTNDRRLIGPLMESLERACTQVLFVDHHPVLQKGPAPLNGSIIDVSAASTGEMVYRLLQGLGVQMTAEMARALYTALVFDTQLFRYVKSDPRSHLMAAELLRYELEPEAVHQALFATYTLEKMSYLARKLGSVDYFADGRVALLQLSAAEARASGLDPDEGADVLDLVMNIESVQVGALLRDDESGRFKLSLRSKHGVPVLALAESFGGGGHPAASGAYVQGDGAELSRQLIQKMTELVGRTP